MGVIADSLHDHIVPIDSIQPMERNPRRGDVDIIAASLDRFGQVKPVVISLDRRILAGNHTHAAAVRLGWTEIAAVTVNLKSTEPEAVALSVADNRTSDLSKWDNDQLLTLLTEINDADTALLAATGFTPDQLDNLTSSATRPPPETDIEPEPDNTVSGITCPNCGYAL